MYFPLEEQQRNYLRLNNVTRKHLNINKIMIATKTQKTLLKRKKKERIASKYAECLATQLEAKKREAEREEKRRQQEHELDLIRERIQQATMWVTFPLRFP